MIIVGWGTTKTIKLNGQSCSSKGYRMAETESECKDIARSLGLSKASVNAWNTPKNCDGQGYYRCEYDSTNLYWNPDCDDNSHSQEQGGNLCILGIWKINQKNVHFFTRLYMLSCLLIIPNAHHHVSYANLH